MAFSISKFVGATDSGRRYLFLAFMKLHTAFSMLLMAATAHFFPESTLPFMPLPTPLIAGGMLVGAVGAVVSSVVSLDGWAVYRQIDGRNNKLSRFLFHFLPGTFLRGYSLRRMEGDFQRDEAARRYYENKRKPLLGREAYTVRTLEKVSAANRHLFYATLVVIYTFGLGRIFFTEPASLSLSHMMLRLALYVPTLTYAVAQVDCYLNRKIAEGKKSQFYNLAYAALGLTPIRLLSGFLMRYRLNMLDHVEQGGRTKTQVFFGRPHPFPIDGAGTQNVSESSLNHMREELGLFKYDERKRGLEIVLRTPPRALVAREDISKAWRLSEWREAYREVLAKTELSDWGFTEKIRPARRRFRKSGNQPGQ